MDTTLKINGVRKSRRVDKKVTREEIVRQTVKSLYEHPFYWNAFATWARKVHASQVTFDVMAVFQLLEAGNPVDSGGRLYAIVVTIVPGQEVLLERPEWFPPKEGVVSPHRNVFHVSVCFDGDRDWLNEEDKETFDRHIENLYAGRYWTCGRSFPTRMSSCRHHGMFHLDGVWDWRINWLHRHGSYHKREFGHIALYPGAY